MTDEIDFHHLPLPRTARRAGLNQARGWLDEFTPKDGSLRVYGWILHPLIPLHSAKIYINDVLLGEAPLILRPDLLKTFPSIPHAQLSGFEITAKWAGDASKVARLTVVGASADGKDKAVLSIYHSPSPPAFEPPPPHLMMRVAGTDNFDAFRHIGLNTAVDILAHVARVRDLGDMQTMLDWGCGCGRLSSEVLQLVPNVRLTGCDIDAEAIAWDSDHIARASFVPIQPYPPTPFADASFNVIWGSSVMTHLSREDQLLWIAEMRRIIRPGGLFLASVHGLFAASFHPGGREWLEKVQFTDQSLDPALDGIAPAGYYRGTFQTEPFTREHWRGKFKILEYVEAGLGCFQDLVVMEPI